MSICETRLRLLLGPSPFEDEPVTRLVFRAGFKAFRQLAPRTNRVVTSAATLGFTLAAAHRVIDRVHDHAAHVWATSPPSRPAGLTAGHVHVIDVSNLANGRVSIFMNAAHFA